MSFAQEMCPLCGALPDWHLVYVRAVVAENARRAEAGEEPDPRPCVVWRNIYRHAAGRKCSRFNQTYDFAPLALAPHEERPMPRVAPVYEQGDAWEPEAA